MEAAVRRCSSKQMILKFRNIHKKTLVLESLFKKVALKFFKHRHFSVNMAKYSSCYRTWVATFGLTVLYTLNDLRTHRVPNVS